MKKPAQNHIQPRDQSSFNRRSFLKRSVVAGALAGLPSLALGQVSPDKGGGASRNPALCQNSYARRLRAYQIRQQVALKEFYRPVPNHPDNGDEARYRTKIASYSKGLPHNNLGEPDLAAYQTYLNALCSGEPADFERIPLGCTDTATQRKLVNPQAGLAYDLEGIDSHATYIPPAPTLTSAEEVAEMIELYWMALTRDVPFSEYGTSPLTLAAAAELSTLSDFRGPKVGGAVTPDTLFRVNVPGALVGPYNSQFRYLTVPYGAQYITQTMRTVLPGQDFMTNYAEWLSIQNGCLPTRTLQLDPVRRYLRNGRDGGQWVHVDALHQAYYQAMLTLLFPISADSEEAGIEGPVDPNNPYLTSRTQEGFGTFGAPHVQALMPEVGTRALKAAWFQKWFVHRRIRPEEYAGRVHNYLLGAALYPLDHPDLLQSPVLERIYSTYGTLLLPMAFPEGCPLHPAYPSGHATVAGASVTILKAWFDESFVIANPVQPAPDGLSLIPYSGPPLTVGGELNKLAANIAMDRVFAGVHWRTDGTEGLKLGEAVAISLLQQQRATFTEDFPGFTFTKFDGTTITI